MNISDKGKLFIKSFESCKLTAYKAVSTEKYWTIGWGHYGSDVSKGQTITQAQADALFDKDIVEYVEAVNSMGTYTQTQFDALVSFAYNCGTGNLRTLVKGRTTVQIAEAMLLYNKSGGKVLVGLTRRRQCERQIFLDGVYATNVVSKSTQTTVKTATEIVSVSIPKVVLGSNSDCVKTVQTLLNYYHCTCTVDGVVGTQTVTAIKLFQKKKGLTQDGIVGKDTWYKLLGN